ncbi:DUF4097 family beta strand repeat-containing protein [Paenibacillus aestuarii]|uniref:DUF4097 domain-containing protein n=1 Tax=Paenibacillus aestuarii TaxID=516965 RepID=A0ABW0K613_9BACL|nr:DUF4097 family beta strand repeat-containing protein [Paenibacillus aestuarii]
MNGGMKFFLVLGFACLAVGLIGSAISFRDTDWTASTTNIDVEKKIAAANIDTLSINSGRAGITFIPGDSDEIKVHLVGAATTSLAENCTVEAETVGTNGWKVNVCQDKKTHFSFNLEELKNLISNHGNRLRTEVTLPNKLYKAITLTTDTGPIDLKEVKAETLTANADTGSITINRYEGKQLNLQTDTGRIEVKDGQGNVRLTTDTGSIEANLHNMGDDVAMQADTGSIQATLQDIGNNVTLTTDTGSVELHLTPPPSSASFDLSTDTGRVFLDIPGVNAQHTDPHQAKATIGDGSNKVTVRTDTGSIRVSSK